MAVSVASTTLNLPEIQNNATAREYAMSDPKRTSIASSVAGDTEFETAPTTPIRSPISLAHSSASSSAHTLSGKDITTSNGTTQSSATTTQADEVNPMHPLSQNIHANGDLEVPIVNAFKNKVQIKEGLHLQPLPQTVGKAALKPIDNFTAPLTLSAFAGPPIIVATANVGPAPPSPPESVDRHEFSTTPITPNGTTGTTTSSQGSNHTIASTYVTQEPEDLTGETPLTMPLTPSSPKRSYSTPRLIHTTPTKPSNMGFYTSSDMHRSSIGTTLSFSSSSLSAPKLQLYRSEGDSVFDGPSTSSKPSHLSHDGYLQPPPMTVSQHRPPRRNTVSSPPSAFGRPSRSLLETHQHLSQSGPGAASFGPSAFEDESGALDSDILLLADQIRRERNSKRAKAQQEAEAAMTREKTARRGTFVEDNPLVGNLIGEDHVNYVLMYNMLTGIRIAVSRCQAKIKRPLTEEDYTAAHKYSFDITGNELTPSARYDFKFKDYAPWVFRELREEYFHLDPADYLLSLTAKYILSELGSPGKSGSFFYFSRDYRFIIKTIHHNEHKFLRSILKDYHDHVKANPHTLLSRFYGLHRVKLPHGRKIHFVIMNNLFPPHKDIHETYDLKGSTVGREYPEEKAAQNPRAVLKDNNWLRRGKSLDLGPEKRAFLTEQIRRDVELLKRLNLMDYSLLVGIHNMKRGNRDNVRSNTLKVFSPDVPHVSRRKTTHHRKGSEDAVAIRRAMRGADPKKLESLDSADLPEGLEDREQFIFYSNEGGYRATDEANQPMDVIYYFGIIDICTRYTVLKRAEHFWKSLSADSHKISPVPALEYGTRFFKFLTGVMRGGNREEFLDKEKTE